MTSAVIAPEASVTLADVEAAREVIHGWG